MKVRRKAPPAPVTDFEQYLDPGGLIPHDFDRFHALCAALIEANGGSTTGPVCPDVLELFLADHGDRLTDYLNPDA